MSSTFTPFYVFLSTLVFTIFLSMSLLFYLLSPGISPLIESGSQTNYFHIFVFNALSKRGYVNVMKKSPPQG